MAVNLLNSSWTTQRQTSTISITTSSTSVHFNMGTKLTDEMACAKACIAINTDNYKKITLKYSNLSSDGISSLYFGVFDNMTAKCSNGKITSASLSGTGVTQITSNSGTVTIEDIPSDGTKYVGFLFYGNTYTLNENVGWSVKKKITLTSLAATERGYTLTYNANGGSGEPSSVSNITSTTISSTVPTRSGYDFLGWSTSSSVTSASYVAGDTITLSANTTLYAVWRKFYTITYDANGGSNAPSPDKKISANYTNLVPISKAAGGNEVYNVADTPGYKNGAYCSSEGGDGTDPACVATGYIPYTWNTDQIIYIRGAGVTSASHVRIYGYVGSVAVPSGSAMCSGSNLDTYFTVEELETGTYYKLTPKNNINIVTHLRLSLVGTGENLIVTINAPIFTLSTITPTPPENTYTTYTVTFNTNGGICDKYLSTIDNVVTYEFINWNTEPNGYGVSYQSGDLYNSNSDITLYAQYAPTTTYSSITLPTPFRENYDFLGWSADEYDTSGITGEYTPYEDTVLYAIWKIRGQVYIYDKLEGFSPYKVLIYDGSGWNQYVPYIYTESGWEVYSG